MIIAYAISLSGMFLLIDGYLGTCHVTAQSPVASLSAASKKHVPIGSNREVLYTKKSIKDSVASITPSPKANWKIAGAVLLAFAVVIAVIALTKK